MAPGLFLAVAIVGAGFTVHAFVPLRTERWWYVPSFFFSWLTIELAGHHLAWQALATWLFVRWGALQAWPGYVGLGISVASWLGLVVLLIQGYRTRGTMEAALAGFAAVDPAHAIPPRRLLLALPIRAAHSRCIRDVVYARVAGRALALDVYLPETSGTGRPAVVQIHGGAWMLGDKRNQGIPVMIQMSEHGWVGFNVNYRLSPGATFPDHLVDIKRAIAWIREHAADYGVDPGFIAITGGSAGGHLAAMVALTSDDKRYQPGFEHADTSVQVCASLYGVYDLVNRLGKRSRAYVDRFIGPIVLKAFYADEPHKFHEASPVDRVHADAPPFLVVHGDRDTMSPLADAELFVARLRAVSRRAVRFARIEGAQHAFDVFLSPRSIPVIEGVHAFFAAAHRLHRDASSTANEPRASGQAFDLAL